MGRVWGPSPTPSLSSLMPAAVRCQIPALASPDPGVGPEHSPTPPYLSGLTWPLHPLESGPPRSTKVPQGTGGEETGEGPQVGAEAQTLGVQSLETLGVGSWEAGQRAGEGGDGPVPALGHWRLGSCRPGWPFCASCSLSSTTSFFSQQTHRTPQARKAPSWGFQGPTRL